MTDEEIKALYASNKDFKEYVDKYSACYQQGGKLTISEALRHRIVHDVAVHYSTK